MTIQERFHRFVADNYFPVNVEEHYRNTLDTIYNFSSLGGPFAKMNAADILRKIDPPSYDIGFTEHAKKFAEINTTFYHRDDAEAAKEEFIRELTNANFSEDEIAEAEAIEI